MSTKKYDGISLWPFEVRCPECRKVFCVRDKEEWAWRVGGALVCSYGCMNRHEARKAGERLEDIRKQARKKLTPAQKEALIRNCIRRGLTNGEIAIETGLSTQVASYYRKKIEEESS